MEDLLQLFGLEIIDVYSPSINKIDEFYTKILNKVGQEPKSVQVLLSLLKICEYERLRTIHGVLITLLKYYKEDKEKKQRKQQKQKTSTETTTQTEEKQLQEIYTTILDSLSEKMYKVTVEDVLVELLCSLSSFIDKKIRSPPPPPPTKGGGGGGGGGVIQQKTEQWSKLLFFIFGYGTGDPPMSIFSKIDKYYMKLLMTTGSLSESHKVMAEIANNYKKICKIDERELYSVDGVFLRLLINELVFKQAIQTRTQIQVPKQTKEDKDKRQMVTVKEIFGNDNTDSILDWAKKEGHEIVFSKLIILYNQLKKELQMKNPDEKIGAQDVLVHLLLLPSTSWYIQKITSGGGTQGQQTQKGGQQQKIKNPSGGGGGGGGTQGQQTKKGGQQQMMQVVQQTKIKNPSGGGGGGGGTQGQQRPTKRPKI